LLLALHISARHGRLFAGLGGPFEPVLNEIHAQHALQAARRAPFARLGVALVADPWAFALRQMDDPAFQPK
jgi:hypothetical protein